MAENEYRDIMKSNQVFKDSYPRRGCGNWQDQHRLLLHQR